MWSRTLQLLQQRLTPKEYTTWIPPMRFVSHADGRLVVGVPSNAYVQAMWEEVGAKLYDAIREVFGATTKLEFCLIADTDNSRSGQVTVPRGVGGETTGNADNHAASGAEKTAGPKPLDSNLNPSLTFDIFVEGKSNRAALNIAKSIAIDPHQDTFNPFFIYGPSGVGKSHLVHAIGLCVKERNPNFRVLYVTAHVFRTQYTDSVVANTINDFIHFYQTIDVLIIDDFQEITTAATQRTFFHIFNHLHQNGHKIIITSDRPPSQFEGLEERLLSRLKWGAVVEMERPDHELRLAILQSLMRRINLELPDDVVHYIADNVSDNVRELEGCLRSLMVVSINDDSEMDLETARRVVARIVGQSRRELTFESIMAILCDKYHIKARDLTGKSRRRDIVAVRQLLVYLTRKYTTLSLSQIGRLLGGRDHSTAAHSYDVCERRLATERPYRIEIEKLEAGLRK